MAPLAVEHTVPGGAAFTDSMLRASHGCVW